MGVAAAVEAVAQVTKKQVGPRKEPDWAWALLTGAGASLGVQGGWGVAGASQAEQACLEGAGPLGCPRACRLVPGKTWVHNNGPP